MPLSVLLITVLVFASIPQTESITEEEKTAIEKGFETGKEVLDIIKSKEFTKTLTKLASAIGPFLGAVGPFVSVIMAFIPMGDSEELKLMKEMMKQIDNRFNQMDFHFDEIERLVYWTKVAVNFGQIEQKILAMDVWYQNLYSSAAEASERRNMFVKNYESDYQNSGLKLYQAIVNKQGTFQENLGESIMSYTKNDRKKTQEMLLGVLRLLMQGAKLEVAYPSVFGFNTTANERTIEWEKMIQTVKNNFEQIDINVADKYLDQSEIDFKKLSANNIDMSNEQFSNTLYSMLIEKYYWRYWFVVVYDAISFGGNHWVQWCYGFHHFRLDERNIVVSSIDKNSRRFRGVYSKQTAKAKLDGISRTDFPNPHGEEEARYFFNAISNIGGCSIISIKTWADVRYRGDPNKIAYRKFNDHLHFILFDNYNYGN